MTKTLNARFFLKSAVFAAAFALGGALLAAPVQIVRKPQKDPAKQAVVDEAARHRPLLGAPIPADLADRLGTAHVSGRYHFTDKPYIVEGAQTVYGLGLRALKLWLTKIPKAYRFNSDWNLSEYPTMVEIVSHPYYKEALAVPFKTFLLEVYPAQYEGAKEVKGHFFDPDSDYAQDEKQVYDLAKYLLTAYKDRDVVFILQNWEGDWMFKGGERASWKKQIYPELERRTAAFARWFAARQRGVERARNEVKDTRAKVFHAIEVNDVLSDLRGVPVLANQVLPKVQVDMISWSSYDGMKQDSLSGDATALGISQGIDILQKYGRTTLKAADGKPFVYIGEMGVPENTKTPDQVADIMDGMMGALFAKKIPYIIHWEVFCNEPFGNRERTEFDDPMKELRGFWLVRPDKSYSHTMRYFDLLLKYAGKTLPPSERAVCAPEERKAGKAPGKSAR